MALVVFLKGVNVGGHRTFRPSVLAKRLKRFDAVNVGAAGTFIIRRPVGRTRLRAEIRRLLPFDAVIVICRGQDIAALASRDPFAGQRADRDIVRFIGIMANRRALPFACPLELPGTARWGLRVLAHSGQFMVGVHRREMKAIAYLGELERRAGRPVTARSWSTILDVSRRLDA